MSITHTTWSRRELDIPSAGITKIYLYQGTGGDASGGEHYAAYVFNDDEIKNYDFWLVHFDFLTNNFTIGKLCWLIMPGDISGSFGLTPWFPITLSNIDNYYKGIHIDTYMNQKPLFIGHKISPSAAPSIIIAWNHNQAVDSYDTYLELVRKPIVKS